MYDTILVPTDGSAHAVRAAAHARYLAERFDAVVHVLSVVDVQRSAGVFDAGGVSEDFLARLEAEAEAAIEDVEAAVDGDESVRTAMVRGAPSETILEYAQDHGVDLLAMGTHGRTGLDRYIMGSVTERVVSRADVPVLTARETARSRIDGDYEAVLVPTDGSDAATAAVDHALAIARAADARVHVVNVVDVGALASGPAGSPPVDVLSGLESAGEAATEAIAEAAADAGLETVTAVREGFPARDLLAYAEEADVDLIAMGTTGQSGLSRYLLGSTTERVIRHAEVPVLAVNARNRASE